MRNNAVMAAKSARWNIGITCRNEALALYEPPWIAASAEKATLVWLSITPLGKPVVPPV
ncbi:hypothetical protein D3C76_1806760 [compost metagenome]